MVAAFPGDRQETPSYWVAMENRGAESTQKYHALKERLRNQSRARQFLDQLENDRVQRPLLEAVAGRFAADRHGQGEILAAMYDELTQNRNPALILRRVTELRAVFDRIRKDLAQSAGDLDQLREWEGYRLLGHGAWEEFVEKELNLSRKVADLLLLIVGQEQTSTFDALVQVLVKGYASLTVSNGEQRTPTRRSESREDAFNKRATAS